MENLELGSRSRPRGISIKEAAAYVGVTPQAYRRASNEGTLPKPFMRDIVDRAAIDAVLDELSGISRSAPHAGGERALDQWLRNGGGRGS